MAQTRVDHYPVYHRSVFQGNEGVAMAVVTRKTDEHEPAAVSFLTALRKQCTTAASGTKTLRMLLRCLTSGLNLSVFVIEYHIKHGHCFPRNKDLKLVISP